MNARQLIEAIFKTGAVFFDTTGAWLNTSGRLYVPSADGTVLTAINGFVKFWAQGQKDAKVLTASPTATVQYLVDNHGLVAVFSGERVAVLAKDAKPIALSVANQKWLSAHLPVEADTQVTLASALRGATKQVTTAGYALFGEREARQVRTSARAARLGQYSRAATPEDEEFAREVEQRAKAFSRE